MRFSLASTDNIKCRDEENNTAGQPSEMRCRPEVVSHHCQPRYSHCCSIYLSSLVLAAYSFAWGSISFYLGYMDPLYLSAFSNDSFKWIGCFKPFYRKNSRPWLIWVICRSWFLLIWPHGRGFNFVVLMGRKTFTDKNVWGPGPSGPETGTSDWARKSQVLKYLQFSQLSAVFGFLQGENWFPMVNCASSKKVWNTVSKN